MRRSCSGPTFATREQANEYAALCNAKAPVCMFAIECGDHWHVWGVA